MNYSVTFKLKLFKIIFLDPVVEIILINTEMKRHLGVYYNGCVYELGKSKRNELF